jgi:sulfite exporter TauE/SafE
MLYFFLTGLVFGSGPCLASCGPILVSYIAGVKRNALGGLVIYLLFSLARLSAYIILSVLVFVLGDIAIHRVSSDFVKYIFIFGGIFIILLGISVASGKRCEAGLQKHGKKTAFGLGIIIGFLPCAPLLAVFSYIGLVSKSWAQSLFYSFSFGAGTFLSPLILLSMLAGLMPQVFINKKAAFYPVFSFICGGIIIFLGVQLLLKGL